MKLTRNRTNIWIRSESNTQKSDKNFGRNSAKKPDKKPIILWLVQPEAYNPEASCWGFRVYKLLLQLNILNVDKTASK